MSLSHFSRQMSQNRECGLNALHVTSNQNVSYGFNLTCHLFPILNYFVGQTNTLQCSDWWGSIPCAPSPEAPIGANLYWRKLQSHRGRDGGREGEGWGGHMAGRLGDPIIFGDVAVCLIDVQLKCTQQIPPSLWLSSSMVVGEGEL